MSEGTVIEYTGGSAFAVESYAEVVTAVERKLRGQGTLVELHEPARIVDRVARNGYRYDWKSRGQVFSLPVRNITLVKPRMI